MSKYWKRIEKNLYRREGSPYLWIQIYANGKRYRESTKTDKIRAARRILKQREGEVAVGKHLVQKQVKFEDLEGLIVKDYNINKRKSIMRLKNSISHLKEHFQGMRADKITPSGIDDYVDSRLSEDAMNGTINRELCALRRMGNLAKEKELIHRFPKIKMLKEVDKAGKPNTRTGFFEHPELLDLKKALPGYMKPVVTLAYESGMRREEILSLEWDQVDLKKGTVTLKPGTTKNDEPRVLYMSPDLKELLTEHWNKRAEKGSELPYVFPNRSGNGRIVNFSKAWRRALKKTGLEGRLFHDFRRTAVRNMVRAGVQESVAMKISGHKDRSIFQRYNIVNEKDLKQASKRMKTYLDEQNEAVTDAKLTHSARVKKKKANRLDD